MGDLVRKSWGNMQPCLPLLPPARPLWTKPRPGLSAASQAPAEAGGYRVRRAEQAEDTQDQIMEDELTEHAVSSRHGKLSR